MFYLIEVKSARVKFSDIRPGATVCVIQKQIHVTLEEIFSEQGLLAAALPQFELRPGQLSFARAVQQAIEDQHFLIAEAGTGTGKTLAYLVPALLSRKKVVVSTGTKTLQEQVFYKDIQFLKGLLPVAFTAALMKGRANYLCLRKFRQFQKQPLFDFVDDAKFFEQIAAWAHTTTTGDRAEISGLPDSYQPWDRIVFTPGYLHGPEMPAVQGVLCHADAAARGQS